MSKYIYIITFFLILITGATYGVNITASTEKIIHGRKIVINPDERGVGAFFFDGGEKYRDKVAQVCSSTGKTETFGSIKERSIRVAIEMRKRGIKETDIIVICSKNTLDSHIPLLGAQYLNAIVASLDPTLSVLDTIHLLGLVQPKMMFICEKSVELIENALKKIKLKAEIVVMGSSTKYSQFSEFQRASPEAKQFKPVVVKNCHDTAFIFFSSGTTGMPKGICMSHYGVLYATETLLDVGLDLSCSLHYSSLYWISALTTLILTYMSGGSRTVCSEFDGDVMAKIIQDYKVTFAFMAPGYTYKLNKENTKYDTSHFKTLVVGGCPISEEQITKTRALLPHTNVLQCYGMTENSGYITIFDINIDKDLHIKKPLACGKPVPGLSLKVVDPSTEELLGPNQQGEIRIHSKSLIVGYYKQDSSDIIDSQGFLKTGDIGYYDEDWAVYIVDRIKDMFKYQSWHIVPAFLEALILRHPDVTDVAVFGTPHVEDGDLPTAAIVLKDNAKERVKPEDIQKFVAERVADRQKLRGGVFFLDNIEKTPSGKIRRRVIRDFVLQNKKL